MDVELELVLPGDVLIESDPPTVFEFREDCRLPVCVAYPSVTHR
jgi:hypothetical protein